jgi:hypothetical protein
MALQPLILYPSRARLLRLILASLALGSMSAVLPFLPPTEHDFLRRTMTPIVAFVGIPFFLYESVYLSHRLLKNRPLLTIDSAGLTDNVTAVSAGFIPWSEIESKEIGDFLGQDWLVVHGLTAAQ